ncbi:MAG TPA: FUSC family protein [Humibacillus xanthopallidus]|nr:FUSC family protein [Humibacillus xanthopallidus]
MIRAAKEMLTLERQRLDLRAGLLGVAVLSVLGVTIALLGTPAMAAVIGALVVQATDPPPPGRSRVSALAPLVVGGALLTWVAVSIGDRTVLAALLVGVVGVAGALHDGRSRRAGIRGLVATIWIIVALTLHDSGVSPLRYAAAFAAGAAVGSAVAWLRGGSAEGVDDDDVETEGDRVASVAAGSPTLRARLRSPLGRFAVLRGLGLTVAVLLGFTMFPEFPAWTAITAVIVMRPPTRQALVVGVQRSLGTGVGVIMAVALAEVVGESRPALVVLFLASAFLMMAVREVNYALFALLVTALVVYTQRILGAGAAESGAARLAETLLGVAIAFVVLGLCEALDSHSRSAP